MDDDWHPVRKFFRTVDLVSMEKAWLFPEQGAFPRAEVLRTVSHYLGRDGGQSDDIIVPKPDGPFVEYEDEWEEQEGE